MFYATVGYPTVDGDGDLISQIIAVQKLSDFEDIQAEMSCNIALKRCSRKFVVGRLGKDFEISSAPVALRGPGGESVAELYSRRVHGEYYTDPKAREATRAVDGASQ